MTPRRNVALATVLVTLWVVATAGSVAAPALIDGHVVLLALLTPRSAYVAMAAGVLPLWVFLPSFLFRLSIGDPVHFLLGRAHGRTGLERLARRLPGCAKNLRRAVRTAARVGLPLTALVPTGTVMAAAGSIGLPFGPALSLNMAGTVVRLLGLWALGKAAPDVVVAAGQVAAVALPCVALVACLSAALRRLRCRPVLAARARHPAVRTVVAA